MVYEKVESDGGFWSPEKEGEILEGIIVRKFDGQFGTQCDIESEKGTLTTPSHKVLIGKLSKLEVGIKVKIVFIKQDLPTVKGKNGTMQYDVYIDRPEVEKVA